MGVTRLSAVENEEVARTARAFGLQWTRFAREAKVDTADLALHLPAGYDLRSLAGVVLDVGCGMGRYTALVHELGAFVVGMDASLSVDKAHELWPAVPFVQADIAAPPFVNGAFDVVYSLGVLHHLPDPLNGFQKCYSLVKPGGLLLVWVYSDHGGFFRQGRRLARRVARRCPHTRFALAAVASLVIYALGLARRIGIRPRKFGYFEGKQLEQIRVDCYDALSAPTEVYLSERDCEQWLSSLKSGPRGFERRSDGSGWILWATRPLAH